MLTGGGSYLADSRAAESLASAAGRRVAYGVPLVRSRQLAEALLSEPAPDSSNRSHPAAPDGPLLAVLVARQAAGAVAERHGVRSVPALMGRSAECDLIFDWPSIAERHGKLTLEEGVWNVTALRQESPVRVDGEAVTDRLPLAPGSSLRLGEVELAFLPCDRLEHQPPPQPVLAAERPLGHRPPPPRFFDDADIPVRGTRWQWLLVGAAILIALVLLALGVGR